MDPAKQHEADVAENIRRLAADGDIRALSRIWIRETARHRYSYNFRWLGRPIIQYPQDVFALQEILWDLKPDLVIETGIAHGGSLVFYASMLELIGEGGRVLGIDLDIRPHNRAAIEAHPMSKRIEMIEGSSVDPRVIEAVHRRAAQSPSVLVVLDSDHASARAGGAQCLRELGQARRLHRCSGYHRRRHACGGFSQPPLGSGKQPKNRSP